MKWRSYLPTLVEAVRRVLGNDVEVYVFGSAIEGKLTVDSDIDIAVVVEELPRGGIGRAEMLERVWKIMESGGVPWWYPFEMHLMTREDLKLLGKTRLIRADEPT